MANNMGNVWVFIEQDDGVIADVSLELVGKARQIGGRTGGAGGGGAAR